MQLRKLSQNKPVCIAFLAGKTKTKKQKINDFRQKQTHWYSGTHETVVSLHQNYITVNTGEVSLSSFINITKSSGHNVTSLWMEVAHLCHFTFCFCARICWEWAHLTFARVLMKVSDKQIHPWETHVLLVYREACHFLTPTSATLHFGVPTKFKW